MPIYLFIKGGTAFIMAWLGRFAFTRRFLAYLFRQQLERLAERSATLQLGPLPPHIQAALASNAPSKQHLASRDDAQLGELYEHSARVRSGVYAIVGERGSGRSTAVQRLCERVPAACRIECPLDGAGRYPAAAEHGLMDRPGRSPRQPHRTRAGRDRQCPSPDPTIMGGLEPFDHLVDVARRHCGRCPWLLSLDQITWRFYDRARPVGMLFDAVASLDEWQEEEIAGSEPTLHRGHRIHDLHRVSPFQYSDDELLEFMSVQRARARRFSDSVSVQLIIYALVTGRQRSRAIG